MYLAGIKLPPLGSIQDGIFRSVFLKQRVRGLRETTLMVLAQGGKTDSVFDIFREHSDDILYTEQARLAEERSLQEQYEQIRHTKPVAIRESKDGPIKVTGL